ncbi:MAG TPA: glycosyltransferase family 39 protein [Vicinamibacteria bacterium]|nr:glycosyltransferase family 39 protein [Vicinamibacteria bacterium]
MALAVSQWPGPPRLAWSDEIVYAAMARNIAAGRGAISSFYDARSIAERSYPLGDVHMPGHALLLSAAFAALGPREIAAPLVPALAFVAAGAVLWHAARRVVSPPAALACALALYVFPSLARYASSAMAETAVVFLACLHLVAWWRALERPTSGRLATLGLLLGVGATVRESFLALLVPSLLLVWRLERGRRLRAGAWLAGPLAVYLVLVFLPLSRARAPHPFYLEELLARPTRADVVRAFADNTLTNLRALAWPGPEEATRHAAALLVVALAASLVLLRRGGPRRLAATYLLLALVSTVLPLAVAYKLWGWSGLRSLLLLAPATLVCAAAIVEELPSAGLRRACTAVALLALVATSAFLDRRLVADRRQELEAGEEQARAIEAALACPGPHVVVAEEAFRYGWRRPDAVVVWEGRLDEAALSAVAARAGAPTPTVVLSAQAEGEPVTAVGCTARRPERPTRSQAAE